VHFDIKPQIVIVGEIYPVVVTDQFNRNYGSVVLLVVVDLEVGTSKIPLL